MIRLSVWLRTPDGASKRAGELRVADPNAALGGALRGEFRYDGDYLTDAGAIALDPVHLPLEPRVFAADRPSAGVHAVFEDSLPDDWGRGLLIRQHRLPRARQRVPDLLGYLGAAGLGALAYGLDDGKPLTTPAPPLHTATLIEAALRYDADPTAVAEADLVALFQAASSPGGARPKLLVEHAGRPCIAKLGSSRDHVELVRVEAACLALAQASGISVPRFEVVGLGRHAALLVERFDVQGQRGRFHRLSLQTLLGAEGWYQLGYGDLADLVRRVSARPELDLPALYRQAVFNALLGNTDDHLKNFSMLRRREGWRLAPAYDLTPDEPPRGEHVLHFGAADHQPDAAALARLARAFGLSATKGARIRAEVAAAMVGWQAVFRDFAVSLKDRDRLAADIERRLTRCGTLG